MTTISAYINQQLNDPIIQAIIDLKSKRIAAQQKRLMNSYGRWSKMMRDKYKKEIN
jgi:hypothetical protein